jgi:organic radical activating enzyme
MINIKETFVSIQGEGYHAGVSSFFIRTQGCDIGCHWCDEPKSWDLKDGKKMSFNTLLNQVKKTNTKNIIITGGEPLMHNLDELTNGMSESGYKLHLETSGAYPLTGKWHWITLSPKKIKPPLLELYKYASELKIIIYNKHDFEWALEQANKVNKSCFLYLQPEWSKRDIVNPLILNFISKNTNWKLSLQMHKYLNIK